MNLDCGYTTGFRNSSGILIVNETRYPHGMVWLGEQIHNLGLKFGMFVPDHTLCVDLGSESYTELLQVCRRRENPVLQSILWPERQRWVSRPRNYRRADFR